MRRSPWIETSERHAPPGGNRRPTRLDAYRRHQIALRERGARGQALVELAIISLVLLLLFATVLDFGRLFYSQITVENAARAGSLIAAQEPNSYLSNTACTTANIDSYKIGCAIQRESRGSLVTVAPSQIAVACENKATPPAAATCQAKPQAGTRSRVSVTATFNFLMPVLTIVMGNSLTLRAAVTADQQVLPAGSTAVPTVASTATPTPTPTPAVTATATATPTATIQPTPVPCPVGQAYVPDLVNGATGVGTPETVSEARSEWLSGGFVASDFTPSSGQTNKRVTGQYTTATNNIVLTPGVCKPTSTTLVYVTYAN